MSSLARRTEAKSPRLCESPSRAFRQHSVRSFLRSVHCVLWMMAALLVAGCSEDIQTDYGRSRGLGSTTSVNGTSVLAKLFEQAGHKVYPWRSLSPRVSRQADCIVWFPTSTKSPSEDVRVWLERWLSERPGRTLVMVLCDYDAEQAYWRKILPEAPEDQQHRIRERLIVAEDYQRTWRSITTPLEAEWFTVQSLPQKDHRQPERHTDSEASTRSATGGKGLSRNDHRQPERPTDSEASTRSATGGKKSETSGRATRLSGRKDWLEGIDAAKTEIEVWSRLLPASKTETLLECEHGVLVARRQWENSQLILVANGSFLLNLPLVNHEHRKLAARLIAEAGPERKQVVFLEPPWGEPSISDKDPSASTPVGLEILTVWPTNWILLHFIVAGLVFCFSRWPIFGLPRRSETEPLSDFGRHVTAMAEHLKKAGDEEFAQATVARYKQQT